MEYSIKTTVNSIPVKDYIAGYRDEEKFIGYCRECRQYGNCWACPPFSFETTPILENYSTAYIIGTQIYPQVNGETFSPDDNQKTGRELLAAVRTKLDKTLLALEKKYPGSQAFYAGTCFSCPNEECTRPAGQPCVQPGYVRHSLEAFGFDIGKTSSELLNIPLQWSQNGELPEYFMLVSGLLTNCEVKGLNNEF